MLASAAHSNAKETLAELRDLARGIHPAVLDRGLGAALAALTETSATPVALTVTIAQRPSPAIEAIAYFCAAELLANVAKHSGASEASMFVSDKDGELLMTVTDNGTGRACITPGGGLAGISSASRLWTDSSPFSARQAGPRPSPSSCPGTPDARAAHHRREDAAIMRDGLTRPSPGGAMTSCPPWARSPPA